jgi:hypothetical protein
LSNCVIAYIKEEFEEQWMNEEEEDGGNAGFDGEEDERDNKGGSDEDYDNYQEWLRKERRCQAHRDYQYGFECWLERLGLEKVFGDIGLLCISTRVLEDVPNIVEDQ